MLVPANEQHEQPPGSERVPLIAQLPRRGHNLMRNNAAQWLCGGIHPTCCASMHATVGCTSCVVRAVNTRLNRTWIVVDAATAVGGQLQFRL